MDQRSTKLWEAINLIIQTACLMSQPLIRPALLSTLLLLTPAIITIHRLNIASEVRELDYKIAVQISIMIGKSTSALFRVHMLFALELTERTLKAS